MTSSGSYSRLQEGNSSTQGGVSFFAAIDEIVNYLNAMTGSRFSSKAKTTLSLLESLFYKGHTLSEMKRVVDSKVSKWGSHLVMEKYLRPSTLFDRYNFTRYLQEVEITDLLTPKIDRQ